MAKQPDHRPPDVPKTVTPKQQRGVSLIELLVGLAVGLLVSVAALGTIGITRVAATTVNDSVRLQQDAALVMRMIGRQLKQAGAFPLEDAATSPQKVQFSSAYTGLDASGRSIAGTNAVRDTFTVGMGNSNDAGAPAADCFGQSSAAVPVIASAFQVTADNVLRCQGLNGQFQPVMDNIEDLQIWYAIPIGASRQYFSANLISLNPAITPNWTQVQGVQVCLQVVGESRSNPTALDPNVRDCAGNIMVSDGRLRQVFRQVFNLRNLQG